MFVLGREKYRKKKKLIIDQLSSPPSFPAAFFFFFFRKTLAALISLAIEQICKNIITIVTINNNASGKWVLKLRETRESGKIRSGGTTIPKWRKIQSPLPPTHFSHWLARDQTNLYFGFNSSWPFPYRFNEKYTILNKIYQSPIFIHYFEASPPISPLFFSHLRTFLMGKAF